MKMNVIRRKNVLRTICSVWLIGILSSCGTAYELKQVKYNFQNKLLSEINENNSVMFVHLTNEMFQIKGAHLNNNRLEAFITPVNKAEEIFYQRILTSYTKKKNFNKSDIRATRDQYPSSNQMQVDTIQMDESNESYSNEMSSGEIYQVHLHANKMIQNDDFIQIDLNEIYGMEIFKKSSNTGLVVALVIIGVILGVFLLFIILLAIACNCPHVYLEKGNNYVYTNTLFTGAVSRNLERYDYKQLPDFHKNETSLSMQIRNEDKETQYTNLLELVVAYHDPSIQVLTDQQGHFYTIGEQKSARKSMDQHGSSLQSLLEELDGATFNFDSPSKNGLVSSFLTFDNPQTKEQAKLVLDLKNSDWAGLVHQQFNAALGSKQEKWVTKNREKSGVQQMDELKKAGVPLVVSIKKGNKWVELESIQPIGNASTQSLVIPIDPSLITNGPIEIRMDGGFMFWELDRAYMDFSAPQPLEISTLSPTSVSGNPSNLAALQQDDQNYLTTVLGSEVISIEFNGLLPKNRSLFVRSKGYYLRQEMSAGTPEWLTLAKMKRTNGLARFSQDTFVKYLTDFNQLSLR